MTETSSAADTPTPQAKAKPARLKPLRVLLPYVTRHRRTALFACLFLALAAITTLTLPPALRRMIDQGFSGADPHFVGQYFAGLIGLAALLAFASAGRFFFVVMLGERVVADLRRDVFAHVTKLSPGFFDTARSGEIAARLGADTTQIKGVVGATASLALRNTILGLGALAMMVVTSPKLSGLVVAAIPLVLLPLLAFGRTVRARSRLAQDRLADATAYAGEQIGAVRTLQAFTNEARANSRFAQAVEDAWNASKLSTRSRAILTFFAILAIFSSVVGVLWIGSHDVMTGAMSPGTLGQFVIYAVFAAGAVGALSEIGGEIQQAAGAAERLSELLAEEPQIRAPADPLPLPGPQPGALAFHDVSFSYPARPDLPTLDRLDFAVRPGETVALVGPSGAGKSSVYALLLRFYDAQQGSVTVDGVDVRRLDPFALRRNIALVPQEAAVFAGTVRENIAYGRPDASNDEIIQAARDAYALSFIERLPQGFDTEIGERGVQLSGGQRQRIAIARAILKDAPILLLDEATSALDAESERLVQAALDRLAQGRTTLVIAHRLATVLKADRILVMEKGAVVEEGTHGELIRRGGTYARLARLQFEQPEEVVAAAE
ncbi:ABC transporter transmembrane domain-containing protein [Mesorhizobium sp. RP14(2022)]|uniref:ABC transporter transmembrane domain-containing protein n=1 Tax=Mesorhizobium liriopis TaxID=2953882 RepID=A0ABT1C946_9HYPH|nr:ABC transporter transmembrane domain-containing protein [Mesorhizobium liriopis]MCO6051307.1 ABC transporter transmembrane domain-containing protein [Mesorhizobium liriopis]